jgi:MFS family permease
MMIRSQPGKSSVKWWAARFAYAAGGAGILANLFLIVMYVLLGLQAGRPEPQTLLGSAFHVAGSASDLLGSLATAFMIPVALFLSGRLPRRRAVRFTQASGLMAMALLTVGGPLLVLGVLAFEVDTLTAVASYIVLSLWLLLVNRWLRLSDALPYRVARLGEFVGAGFLAGYLVVGLGLLLPWMSWPQLVVFGFGVLVGLPAYLVGIPVWFLLLGRHLGKSWPYSRRVSSDARALWHVLLRRQSSGRVVL